VFALTLCIAALAGFGMNALRGLFETDAPARSRRLARVFGWALTTTGALSLSALVLMRVTWPAAEPLITRLLTGMARADQAFSDARMFFSVQAVNVLIFGAVMLASGILFLWAVRPHRRTLAEAPAARGRLTAPAAWSVAAVLLIALDLSLASAGFNPASDPAWLDYEPPAITWMRAQPDEWRYITLDDPTQRPLLNANLTLRYGLDDVRGYESIIPRQTVDTMQALAPQVQLDFNRIAPLYTTYGDGFDVRDALTSPLLDALNIRYVVTHLSTDLSDVAGLREVYADDAVRIWENSEVYPRAQLVTDAGTIGTAVERFGGTSREHLYALETDGPAELVISETYLPGWRAYSRPADDPDASETLLDVRLVDGQFIGVALPEAGAFTVRVVYSPQSFQIGLFTSFIALIILMLIGGLYLWRTLVSAPAEGEAGSLNRVARNSTAPILLNLFNRGIDFAFAFVMLRVLGPEQAGAYFYAGVIFVWFDIFTNFGLNLFLTREVARDPGKTRLYFFNTSALRIGLALVGVPILAGFLGVRQSTVTPPLDASVVLAIALLYIGLIPNSLSTGLTALFYAYERAEMPALVATVATISKTVGGLAALLLGYGIVGLAAVSIITNVVTLIVLWLNARSMLGDGPVPRPDRALIQRMAGASWPLMLNHFLQTIFFQIDVVLIEAIHGAGMVGQYQIAYKWVTALNIIPAFFTQAMLPLMSRQAQDDPEALRRNYVLAIKLLVSVALPAAVIVTFAAFFLTALLGGAQYLPDGAIATQIMIWSIPIGWMNSFGQYMLIALDLQRRITGAFALAVGFNLISNFLLIPQYGYQAAAFTTILSELVLFVPFYLLLRPAIGPMPWVAILWRPVTATAAMIGVMLLTWPITPLLGLAAGVGAYAVLWYGLRALDASEWGRLAPLIPRPLRGRLVPRVG
jgi:O-antigen/teichoic acid export membrane protein